MSKHKGLGRLPVADYRDHHHPIENILRTPRHRVGDEAIEAVRRGYRYWFDRGWTGDQEDTPQCVAYAALHALEDGPHTLEDKSPGADPIMDPGDLYVLAQDNDEWPGRDYDGTSARGAAKVLLELGLIREYMWAFTAEAAIQTVLRRGPVLLGCIWMSGMDEPDAKGFIHPTGFMRGGHEVEINGVNTNDRKIRIKNSWGKDWGDNGNALLSFEDFAFLLEKAGGDACILVQ